MAFYEQVFQVRETVVKMQRQLKDRGGDVWGGNKEQNEGQKL